jgi:saccharopine dehydrogenase-like NADP-dependent oxidoreductase
MVRILENGERVGLAEMKKIVLLGCGFHGRGIAYHLAQSGAVELRVLDRDERRASAVGHKAGVRWGTVDVTDKDGLRTAIKGADVVVNAVGPYHRTALGVIDVAIDSGVHYVDMNDDHEVAEAVLLDASWDDRARRADVTVLIDCGVVPGLSGMLVKYGSNLLEQTEEIAITFAWNYNRQYPAAIQHFLRINSGRGPQYIDGGLLRMSPLEGLEDVDFQEPVGRTSVYFTGVPDPIAIARFIPDVRSASAKGAFYQKEANRLLGEMIRWGFTSYEPPTADSPSPMDYLVTYIGSAPGERYFEIPRKGVPLAVRVRIKGMRSEKPVTLSYEAHDLSRRATTTFTALAAFEVAERRLAPGVLAREAWPHPDRFLNELLSDDHVRILQWSDDEIARPLEIRGE